MPGDTAEDAASYVETRRYCADLTNESRTCDNKHRPSSRDLLAARGQLLDGIGRNYPALRLTKRPQLVAPAAITRALWKIAEAKKRGRVVVPARGSVARASHGASPAQDATMADNDLEAVDALEAADGKPDDDAPTAEDTIVAEEDSGNVDAPAADDAREAEEDSGGTIAKTQQESDKERAELQALRESSAATEQDLREAHTRAHELEEALADAQKASAL